MSDLKFSKDHEWILLEGDIGTIGISVYAQEQLGDVVYVELPEIGKSMAKGEDAAVVESVKAASEVMTPVGGEVVAVNEALNDAPAKVNEDAQGEGWFLKLRIDNAGDLAGLMDEAAYLEYVKGLD